MQKESAGWVSAGCCRALSPRYLPGWVKKCPRLSRHRTWWNRKGITTYSVASDGWCEYIKRLGTAAQIIQHQAQGAKGRGCAPARAAQGDTDLLCCHDVLLAHGHLVGHQDLLCRAAFQLAAPRLYWCRACSCPGAGLCISRAQLHNVPVGPLLQLP